MFSLSPMMLRGKLVKKMIGLKAIKVLFGVALGPNFVGLGALSASSFQAQVKL